MMKQVLVAFIVVCTLSSCFLAGGKRVRGNGNIVTEERQLPGIEGIESFGSFQVFLTAGSNSLVKIETDENLMEYVETELRGGVLRIKTPNRYSIKSTGPIKVYVTAPVFRVVKTSGSGNIKGNNQLVSTDDELQVATSGSGDISLDIQAAGVSADISGSGNIILAGEASTMKGSIAGSGDIRAADLKTRQSEISISGSGNTSITAQEKLDVRIAGSGDVKYRGNPSISSHVAGSGSVTKID